jgi:Uma2 family endonuclease
MSVEELAALPEDDHWCYELVEGVLVRMPPSSFGASKIGGRLFMRLGIFVTEHKLGSVTGEQGGYILDPQRPKQTQVAPDVGFVSAERDIPVTAPAAATAFPGAPDLAVEVAAPRQSGRSLGAKAQRYLGAGTRLVWIIWPQRRQVEVWHPGRDRASAILGAGDSLDGEDVVPGFRCPIADLFAD